MRLLLDTHILLWWLANDPALPARTRELIADPGNTIYVSAVSICEIWLEQSLGKLRLSDDFEDRLAGESFESLPLTALHARRIGLLPWRHRDPFDRRLIAQAEVEQLRFLTANEAVSTYGDSILLAH